MMVPPTTSIKEDNRPSSCISRHSFKLSCILMLLKNIPVFWRTSSSKTVESPQASPAPPVAHVEERPPNGRGLQIWSKCLGGQIWQCFLGKVILMTKDEDEKICTYTVDYILYTLHFKYCQDGLRQQLFWCLFPWTPWEKGYDCIYIYTYWTFVTLLALLQNCQAGDRKSLGMEPSWDEVKKRIQKVSGPYGW